MDEDIERVIHNAELLLYNLLQYCFIMEGKLTEIDMIHANRTEDEDKICILAKETLKLKREEIKDQVHLLSRLYNKQARLLDKKGKMTFEDFLN